MKIVSVAATEVVNHNFYATVDFFFSNWTSDSFKNAQCFVGLETWVPPGSEFLIFVKIREKWRRWNFPDYFLYR